MNLNYKKFKWVQCRNETCESLHRWVARNCPDFEEMKITRVVKYVGAMIGPDGHLHRWTAHRNKFVTTCGNMNESSESLVERLVEFKIYLLDPVMHYLRLCCWQDQHLCLALTYMGSTLFTAWPRGSTATRSSTLADGLAKIRSARNCDRVTLHAVSAAWDESMLDRSTASAHNFVYRLDLSGAIVGSLRHKMQRTATTLLCEMDHTHLISPDMFRNELQRSLHHSADGTKISLIVFAITTVVHASQLFSPDSGGAEAFGYGTISSHEMESWYWACLMPLCMHTTVIAMIEKTQDTLWRGA